MGKIKKQLSTKNHDGVNQSINATIIVAYLQKRLPWRNLRH
jgi:hypothetical protein